MFDNAKEMCGSVRVARGGENPKNAFWNGVVKDAVKRKEATWREVLGATDEVAKDRYMEVNKKR